MLGDFGAAHVFADGDVFHLGGDDALAGIPELGDGVAGAGAQRAASLAFEAGEFDEAVALGLAGVLGVFAGEVAVVLRFHFAAVVGLGVAAGGDPGQAERGQAFFGGAGELRVAPGAAAIVDADGGVGLGAAAHGLGGRQRDLAQRYLDIGEEFALHVDAGAGGELVAAVRGAEGVLRGDHGSWES